MQSLIIVGSGGHAKVIIDILLSNNQYKIIGCVSQNLAQKELMGVKILGDDSILPELYRQGINNAFVAIGDNKSRKKITDYVKSLGYQIVNAISSKSHISTFTQIGQGVAIMPGVTVNAGTTISNNVIINTCASVDHDCYISSDVHIAPGCHIAGNVHVGNGTFLGVGCSVIPQIKIGDWSIIGAGSVIIKNLPAEVLAVGVPAKVIKSLK